MKTVRFITFMIVAILILSAWTPSLAYAKADAAQATTVAKLVKLTITNNTSGILYISLSGSRFYSFVAANHGKNTFLIEKGKYTATIRASACGGLLKKKIDGGGSLGAIVCRNH